MNYSYLTILKFSLEITFSIFFLGDGKSILFRKKIMPMTTIKPKENLTSRAVILALPDLVFLSNSI